MTAALPSHALASETFVLPRLQLVYYAVPKAACTSLKWAVASLNGEDASQFVRSTGVEAAPSLTVHDRALWRRTPTVKNLRDKTLRRAMADDWFRFAVTRDPLARLWSAWQSKILLHDPHYLVPAATFVAAPPRTMAEVASLFEEFVTNVLPDSSQRIGKDQHFKPQSDFWPRSADESLRLYKTNDLVRLIHDVNAHVADLGANGVELQRFNETPLSLPVGLLSPAVFDTVFSIYEEDYARFGYRREVPAPAAAVDAPHLPGLIGLVWDKHERIAELGQPSGWDVIDRTRRRANALQRRGAAVRASSPRS